MMIVTLEEAKAYLRVDFNDDDSLINSLIDTADEYLKAAISETYNTTSGRAKMLALIVVGDLYDNREMSEKVSGNVRRLVQNFALQLRLESGDTVAQ